MRGAPLPPGGGAGQVSAERRSQPGLILRLCPPQDSTTPRTATPQHTCTTRPARSLPAGRTAERGPGPGSSTSPAQTEEHGRRGASSHGSAEGGTAGERWSWRRSGCDPQEPEEYQDLTRIRTRIKTKPGQDQEWKKGRRTDVCRDVSLSKWNSCQCKGAHSRKDFWTETGLYQDISGLN